MEKKIKEIAIELCPHYANGMCYYIYNESSPCDCECEFCWAVSVLLNENYCKEIETLEKVRKKLHKKFEPYMQPHSLYSQKEKELFKVFLDKVDEILKEFTKKEQ